MPCDNNKQLEFQEIYILFPDLFKNWEKLYVSIVMMPLFTHIWHNNNKVKSHTTPAQHHDDIDEIKNSSKKQNKQNDISEMKDLLRVL